MLIEISSNAMEDLNEVWNYIAIDSIFYANKFINELIDYIEILEGFPKCGKIIFIQEDVKYRRIVFHKYNIIYFIDGKVYIILIYNSNRNFNYLKFRLKNV